MGPKVQQKKLWDQIETLAKVMGLKVHLDQYLLNDHNRYTHSLSQLVFSFNSPFFS